MVELRSTEEALKTVYLDVLTNQLNTKVNPLLARIDKTTSNIVGGEIVKHLYAGITGGIGAGDEGGSLPTVGSPIGVTLRTDIKNLYGTIEVSDKIMCASANSNEFVNVINRQMEGLVSSSKFNLSRMLFGDGKGQLGSISLITGNVLTVSPVNWLIEGMLIDIYDDNDAVNTATAVRVKYVDRTAGTIQVEGDITDIAKFNKIYAQGSMNKEINGVEALFDTTGDYGDFYTDYPWLKPYSAQVTTLTDTAIQSAIDAIEEKSGNKINYIVCSAGVKRAYVDYMLTNRTAPNTFVTEEGFTAIDFNGIPMVVDRFVPTGKMYLLNTDAFHLHQLCDWKWLEDENGNILKQIPGKAAYSATLVKYCNLVCDQPGGQGRLTNITEK